MGKDSSRIAHTLTEPQYELPEGVSDGIGIFTVDSETGRITLTVDLLSTSTMHTQFLLHVMASDSGQTSRSATHILALIPVPVPSFQSDTRIPLCIDEELGLGTVVLVPGLSCSEVGPSSDSIATSLSGIRSETFRVDRNSELIVSRRIDYEALSEAERTFVVTATCMNRFQQADTVDIDVTVINIDDNLFAFTHREYTALVLENTPLGTYVLSVQAGDGDVVSPIITYRFPEASAETADFRIIPETGDIVVHGPLDREFLSRYELAVQAVYTAVDGTQEIARAMVTIDIGDLNDMTPRFEEEVYVVNSITTVSESGDLVIAVSAIDEDTGRNADLTYQLFDDDNMEFDINETTGEIFIMGFSLTHGLHMFRVNATDDGESPLSGSAFVYVYVQSSPKGIVLTLEENPIDVPEDTPVGSQIGRISSAIVDDSNTTLNETSGLTVTFRIVYGSDPDRFHIGRTTGEIFTLGSLDHERLATEYDLVVVAELELPEEDLTLENRTVVVVRVGNIDDNPPRFTPMFYTRTVEEFTGPNITILTVSASDPDMLSDIEYILAGEDSSAFQIDASTGAISALSELATPQDYRFSAVGSDGGEEVSEAVVFVSVTRSVSVEPGFTQSVYIFNFSENAAPGTLVGVVSANTIGGRPSFNFTHLGFQIDMPDPTEFDPTEFNLTALALDVDNASQSLFHIDTVSGEIRTRGTFEFDLETRQDYAFYVQVYNVDDGTLYDVSTVEVRLEDENDNPPVFDRSLYTAVINTSRPLNSVVIVVTATDRDSGTNQEVTYSFEGQDLTHRFALDPSTGEVTVSNSTLIPGGYHLQIEASDGATPALTASTTVFIVVIPATPTEVEFSEQTYYFDLVEDAPPDTLVGVVVATDSNSSYILPSLTYHTPNVTDCFNIDARNGELKLSCSSLDRDSTGSYELAITARIGDDNIVAYGTVVVTLLDVNDNAPEFSLDIYNRVIDDRYGNDTAIIRVVATDVDNGTNGTVEYSFDPSQVQDVFRIDSESGNISLVSETVALGNYRLLVQATDGGDALRMSSTALVLVSVNRAHPQTLRFANASLAILENEPPSMEVGMVVLTTNGGNVIDPADFPDNLEFSIVGGDSPNLFTIDSDTGLIRTQTQTIDREMAASHVVKIRANFTLFPNFLVPSVVQSFSIEVLDVNDNAPQVLSVYSTLIFDDAVQDQVIFNITAMDIDSGANAEVTFSIDPEPSTVFDVINSDPDSVISGVIFVNDTSLLFPGIYQFSLYVTDGGDPSMMTTAAVEVIVEHNIPEVITFNLTSYTFSVAEESERSTPVGRVSVLPDMSPALDELVYLIPRGSQEVNNFLIDVGTGEIRTGAIRLNRETNPSFSFNVSAFLPRQDPPLVANEVTVYIYLDDVNDNDPVFSEAAYPTVGLDTDQLSTDTPLLTVSATDIDTGTNSEVEYSIASININQSIFVGDFGSLFNIDNSTGGIFPAFLGLEVGFYYLRISGMDKGMPTRNTGYTTATIVLQRPAPTSISFTNATGYTFRLLEGSGIVDVGQVMLEDIPDYLLEFVTYSGDEILFRTESSGSIGTTRNFDYEVEESFRFEVTGVLAITSRTPSVRLVTSVNVTVEIVDVNDNTPYFIDFPSEIVQYEQRESVEVVHTIVANDSDSGTNSQLTYTVLNTDLDNLLFIDAGTGRVMTAAGLDREDPAQGTAHPVIIQVCDNGVEGLCVEMITLFQLLDINDNYPLLSSGFMYEVNERFPPQSRVFSLMGVDLDVGENSTITYALSGATDVPFICDEVNGQVRTTQELDYEVQTSYNVHVTLTDLGTPVRVTQYTNITVRVVDLPDNTPRFNQTAYSSNMSPSALQGDLLFLIQAIDADIPSSNDSLKYAITDVREAGNDGATPELRIDENTGRISSARNQVFVPEAVFTIDILVYDQSQFNLSSTTTLTITVVPNLLVFTQLEYEVTIDESVPLSTMVAILPIEELSATSDISFTIEVIDPMPTVDSPILFTSSGNGEHAVTIFLTTQGPGLDREDIPRFTIEAVATRPNSETARTRLVVIVGDFNDNRPIFSDSNNTVVTVPEDAVTQEMVTKSNATDRDIGENARLVYTLLERNSPFEIDGTSGVIQTRGILNYEEVQAYDITVVVRDSGSPALENRITYRVNVLNVNDEFPVFAARAYFGEIYANAPPGDYVQHTELVVTDADDMNNQQELSFDIYFPSSQSVQDMASYVFAVERGAPYRIRVLSLPENSSTVPSLLELRIEVADEGNKRVLVPLYISVFTSNNIALFLLTGVSQDLLFSSCDNLATSLCAFRESVALLYSNELGSLQRITFYNYSVTPVGIEDSTLVARDVHDMQHAHVHVHNMHAHVHDMHAHVHEMHNMHAHVHEIHAHAHNMHAHACINYNACTCT